MDSHKKDQISLNIPVASCTDEHKSRHISGCTHRDSLNIPLLDCIHPSDTSAKAQRLEQQKYNLADHDHSNNINGRGGWKTIPFIIGNNSCEQLATVALLANMTVYLTTQFNMNNVVASNILNIWSGTASLSPLMGAFISDSYIGRFLTISLASIATAIGMIMLTLTAAFPRLRPPPCASSRPPHEAANVRCVSPSNGQIGLLFTSFAFLGIGAGGTRPCSIAFGGDQFDNQSSPERRRYIQRFFNLYYCSSAISIMVALTIIVYIQERKSWSWGLGIPTALVLFSMICFLLGAKFYILVPPEGSSFTSFARVVVAAMKKRHLPLPPHSDDLYNAPRERLVTPNQPLTDHFRFLNKAAIKTPEDFRKDGSVLNPWRLCSLQQVEELKSVIRIAPIWASGIVIFIDFAQQRTFSVLQALTMDRHLGKRFQIPAGSFGIFSMLSLTVCLLIYDRILVPISRHVTKQEGGLTLLQRMGIGLVFSILAVTVAGIVEAKRRGVALACGLMDEPNAVLPMSALWLVPQHSLAGIAEALNAVGQMQFLYSQFPQNMRSVAGALIFCSAAVANYLSSVIVTVVHRTTGKNGHSNWLPPNLNQGNLDYFYWLLAGLGALNLLFFLVCARRYKYNTTVLYEIHNTTNESSSHV